MNLRAEDLGALVDAAADRELPQLIGALEAAKATALARLTSPARRHDVAGDAEEARLLGMAEVAKRLGVTEHQARELGRRGELPTVTVGARGVRVSLRALEEWIAARERGSLRGGKR